MLKAIGNGSLFDPHIYKCKTSYRHAALKHWIKPPSLYSSCTYFSYSLHVSLQSMLLLPSSCHQNDFHCIFFSSTLEESCFITIAKSRPWESGLTLLWRASHKEPSWTLRKGERRYISLSGSWATAWKQWASLPLYLILPCVKKIPDGRLLWASP